MLNTACRPRGILKGRAGSVGVGVEMRRDEEPGRCTWNCCLTCTSSRWHLARSCAWQASRRCTHSAAIWRAPKLALLPLNWCTCARGMYTFTSHFCC